MEQKGGVKHRSGMSRDFVSWYSHSHLIDLGFHGPKFTWQRRSLLERLDRALNNQVWRIIFSEASIFHLTRLHSDPRPLLVKVQSFTPRPSIL